MNLYHVCVTICLYVLAGFPGGTVVKNPPAMQKIQVWSLGQEDPLEKKMPNHFSILAWKIPWTEEPGGGCPRSRKRAGHDWVTWYVLQFLSEDPICID